MLDKILAFAEERGQTYLRLARAFTYPEREIVEELLDEKEISNLIEGSIDEILNLMQVEYTRLFINTAYKSLLAPPYESYYRSEQSLLMHTSTITELQYLFKQIGLVLDEESDLSPDHIAVEFEFMSYLVEEEIDYRKNNDEAKLAMVLSLQKSFIEAHLAVWLPQFFERILQHSNNTVYKKMSQISQNFLQDEVNYFRSI